MNHRMALKIENDGLEQWYKFRDGAFDGGVKELKESVDNNFINNAIEVFTKMQSSKIELLSHGEEEMTFEDIT